MRFLGTCAPEQEEIAALIPYRAAYDANLASFRQLEKQLLDVRAELAEERKKSAAFEKIAQESQKLGQSLHAYAVKEIASKLHLDNRWRRFVAAAQLNAQQMTMAQQAWDQYGDTPTPEEVHVASAQHKTGGTRNRYLYRGLQPIRYFYR